MAENQSEKTYKKCVGCCEKILIEALVCPKCRSRQKPPKWENLLLTLKWIGGITALISLIIGVKQIGSLVKEWQERDKAVNQIVMASEMLLDNKDFQAAWEVAKKATDIAPSSQKAFNQQVDVAMEWIRGVWPLKDRKTYSEIIDPLILTLSQGAGNENPYRAATVLAHIGWANYWRLKDEKKDYEVESYFLQALKSNPKDTYANLFRGYWLLTYSYKDKDGINKEESVRLSEAISHFKEALETDENQQYVYTWFIMSLTGTHVKGANVEAIKIANKWRKQNKVPILKTERKSALNRFLSTFGDLYVTQLSEDSLLTRLKSQLSAEEIRDTFTWLLNEVGSQDWMQVKSFYLGLIYELGGDLKNAYDSYIEIFEKEGSSKRFGKYTHQALCRLLFKLVYSDNVDSEVLSDIITKKN